jgi:hypothetical protein
MNAPIDSFSLICLGILLPLLQVLSLLLVVQRRRKHLDRSATLRSVYWTLPIAIAPWVTYGVFSYLLLNLLTHTSPGLVVVWSVLTIVNRIVLPLSVGLALLPPYPPKVWLSTIYRLSVVGMAIVANQMTQYIFPIDF